MGTQTQAVTFLDLDQQITSFQLHIIATRLGTTLSLLFRHFEDYVLKPRPKNRKNPPGQSC